MTGRVGAAVCAAAGCGAAAVLFLPSLAGLVLASFLLAVAGIMAVVVLTGPTTHAQRALVGVGLLGVLAVPVLLVVPFIYQQ